jgi:hypothetical protein
MSECAREIEWAGGKHVFNLADKRVMQVIDLIGLSDGPNGDTPAAVLKRFEESSYSIKDVEGVIHFGLVGGGMSPHDADRLLDQHVRGKPLASSAMTAFAVLMALFLGEAANAGA